MHDNDNGDLINDLTFSHFTSNAGSLRVASKIGIYFFGNHPQLSPDCLSKRVPLENP
jgi:hypothetical protein